MVVMDNMGGHETKLFKRESKKINNHALFFYVSLPHSLPDVHLDSRGPEEFLMRSKKRL